MIPTRKFPYTDFHDLNLDWLLEKFNNYELDLDDIKRRLTALEEWRVVIDTDIRYIKQDIEDNSISYFIIYSSGNVQIYKGSMNTTPLNNDTDTFEDIYKHISGAKNNLGYRTANFYIYSNNTYIPVKVSGKKTITANIIYYDFHISYETYSAYGTAFTENDIRLQFNSYNQTLTVSRTATRYNTFKDHFNLEIDPDDIQGPTSDPDFPYYYELNDGIDDASSQVLMYFMLYDQFKTYSNIVCPMVETLPNNTARIRFKIKPSETLSFYVYVGGEG